MKWDYYHLDFIYEEQRVREVKLYNVSISTKLIGERAETCTISPWLWSISCTMKAVFVFLKR